MLRFPQTVSCDKSELEEFQRYYSHDIGIVLNKGEEISRRDLEKSLLQE